MENIQRIRKQPNEEILEADRTSLIVVIWFYCYKMEYV